MTRAAALLTRIAATLGASLLAACTTSQAGSIPPAASPNVAQTSSLQFAVGTATIAVAGGGASIGLNVVATFRQPNGNNATNVNTPTITAPRPFNFGPLLGNSNVVSGATPAQVAALAAQVRAQVPGPTVTPVPVPVALRRGFGPLVGVFGYGLAADNLISSTDLTTISTLAASQPNGQLCIGVGTNYFGLSTGVSGSTSGSGGYGAYYGPAPAVGVITSNLVRSAELALPVPSGINPVSPVCVCPSTCAPFGSIFADPAFPIQYFGGPPAWPSPQGYGNYSYFVGYPLGFTTFTATPFPGSYSLSVAFPTSANYSTFGTVATSAKLTKVAPLPIFPQPVLTINSDGSALINVNVPAGVREAVITIVTNDCDLSGREKSGVSYYNHYALETQRTGPQQLYLSSALGPPSSVTGLPTHTFCTLGDVQAFNALEAANNQPGISVYPITTNIAAVGFDYAAVESSYPFNTSATPPITNGDGHTGQADVTTSYPSFVSTLLSVPSGG